MFHTPNVHLVPLQAEAAGFPLVTVDTEGIKEAELADLTRAIALAVERHGIEGVVTGALMSVYQATRVQQNLPGARTLVLQPALVRRPGGVHGGVDRGWFPRHRRRGLCRTVRIPVAWEDDRPGGAR